MAAIARANHAQLNKENYNTQHNFTNPLSGCQIVNIDQLRDSIGTLTAHSTNVVGNVSLKKKECTQAWPCSNQASCVKCGQNFSIRTSPRVQTSSGEKWTVGQLGCSSWRNVHRWWFDMVELHTSTYGCPSYAKANVYRH